MSADKASRSSLVSQSIGGQLVITDMGVSTGRRFYVDSGSATGSDGGGSGRNPESPKLTLDEPFTDAIVTASNGDIIYCMPGHAENLAADSTVDMDIAGVKVIGIGEGAARPTFTCTVTTGDFKLAAASSVIENLLFLNDIDNSTGLLEVSAADCKILDCEFRESDAAKFADMLILTTAAADRLEIGRCSIIGNTADGAVSAISLIGADGAHIHDCWIYGDFSTANIDFATTLSALVSVHDCTLWNDDATAGGDAIQVIKDSATSSTGIIGPNVFCFVNLNAANITGAISGATFTIDQRGTYVANLAGEMGIETNILASTD